MQTAGMDRNLAGFDFPGVFRLVFLSGAGPGQERKDDEGGALKLTAVQDRFFVHRFGPFGRHV